MTVIRTAIHFFFNRQKKPPKMVQEKIKKWDWFLNYFWNIAEIEENQNINTGQIYRSLKLRFNQDGIFGFFSSNPELQYLIDLIYIEMEKFLNPAKGK